MTPAPSNFWAEGPHELAKALEERDRPLIDRLTRQLALELDPTERRRIQTEIDSIVANRLAELEAARGSLF